LLVVERDLQEFLFRVTYYVDLNKLAGDADGDVAGKVDEATSYADGIHDGVTI